jgi:hypothetical protein
VNLPAPKELDPLRFKELQAKILAQSQTRFEEFQATEQKRVDEELKILLAHWSLPKERFVKHSEVGPSSRPSATSARQRNVLGLSGGYVSAAGTACAEEDLERTLACLCPRDRAAFLASRRQAAEYRQTSPVPPPTQRRVSSRQDYADDTDSDDDSWRESTRPDIALAGDSYETAYALVTSDFTVRSELLHDGEVLYEN